MTASDRERLQFAARMEMLACWFDDDDFAKGRAGRTEVQEDLRRWAAAARDLDRQEGSPLALIAAELNRAYVKHGREPWGRHEFYGVLKEEVDELWDVIKADEPIERVHAEAIQVAAMCVRYIETGDKYGFTGRGSTAGND